LYNSIPECHRLSFIDTTGKEHAMNLRLDQTNQSAPVLTPNELMEAINKAELLSSSRKRDLISAVSCICRMGQVSPQHFAISPQSVRRLLSSIEPAAHGISGKSYGNIQSNLRAALAFVGAIDQMPRASALRNQAWSPLIDAIQHDKRLAYGLARFMTFCASRKMAPDHVSEQTLGNYAQWLQTRTIEPDPEGKARKTGRLWNLARERVKDWPRYLMPKVGFGLAERKTPWEDLPAAFRKDAEGYLEARRNPDPFDERPNTATRPISEGTLRLQQEYIRLAFHILLRLDTPPASLAELVEAERFTAVLRHYYDRAAGKPNAFANSFARALLSIAKSHVRVEAPQLERLKKIAAKLPPVPFDLTAKNRALIHDLQDERVLASLFAVPARLMTRARESLQAGSGNAHVDAIAGLAIGLLLAAPMRSQNLVSLNWRRHVREPRGRRGPIRLLIPAGETKTKRLDLLYELDQETTDLLRWYRAVLLPAIGADPDGDLFALPGGRRASQSYLSLRVTEAIRTNLGVHMTPHQFRHLAAALYLEAQPQDFETIRQLLGHSFGKTTLIYAGLSSERASRSYSETVIAKRAEITKLIRPVALRSRSPARQASDGSSTASNDANSAAKKRS
jgi:integrase